MEKNITPDDGDMEQKLKNGKFLIVFQDEISKMIQKVKSTGTSEKIDILDIVPEELTEVDARMWQKLKNYPESIILQEELDNYTKEIKDSKNNSRLQFLRSIFNQKITPILLNIAQSKMPDKGNKQKSKTSI